MNEECWVYFRSIKELVSHLATCFHFRIPHALFKAFMGKKKALCTSVRNMKRRTLVGVCYSAFSSAQDKDKRRNRSLKYFHLRMIL